MEKISRRDREILRAVATRKAELAHSDQNERILKAWRHLANGERACPTVRLLFSNFKNEVLSNRLQCEGNDARRLEAQLLSSMVGRELFDDDTPVSDTFDTTLSTWAYPFTAKPKKVRAKTGMGFHIEPVTDDIEENVDMFLGGSFSSDMEATKEWCAYADEVFGDILPSRIVQGSLSGMITNPLVQLVGMETYYTSMYDCPDVLHRIMDEATSLYERYYDHLEKDGLLLPVTDMAPVAQESFAFNSELPKEGKITSTNQVWGFLESQETTAVSPETFGEFVFPYQDRLVKRYGLLSYGCCERVDAIFEDYLSKWKNLRKLSVSPFNDERRVGDYLRGSNIVFYSKPRAEYVTNAGPLDEEAILRYFKGVCEAASGCLFEIAQREVGTIFGDYGRGKRYVELAKQAVETYWKP